MKWETVKLIDVCDFQGGTQPPKSSWSTEHKPGYVRMLQIRDFTQGKESFIEYVKDIKTLKKCNQEDILIGRYGASIGKILTGLSGAYNVALVKTVPTKRISRRYLYFYLLSDTFQNFIQNAGSRAAQAGFNKEELGTLNISLPPLHIQEQIADTLDKADALRRKDQELLTKYDELAQAIFYDMFGDPVTNEKGWTIKKLGELADHISSGSTPLGGSNVYKTTGILFIRSQNVLMRSFDISDAVYITEETHLKMKRTWVNENDVLLNITGASIGRVGVYKYKQIANVNQHVCIIRCIKDLINPDYLMYLLASHTYQNQIIGRSSGGTRESFTFTQIKQFDIILPPLELQDVFMKQISNLNKIISNLTDTSEASNKLFNSLISSNF